MGLVNKSNDIRNEFLEFGKCTKVNGEAISNEILQIIKKVDLDIMNCRGQGYSEASNISSESVIYFYLNIIAFTFWSQDHQEQDSSICNTIKKV